MELPTIVEEAEFSRKVLVFGSNQNSAEVVELEPIATISVVLLE